MRQPVQHSVSDSGVADVLVLQLHRHLAGDDGGPVMPVINHFHQVAPLFRSQRNDRSVVEDQQLHPR